MRLEQEIALNILMMIPIGALCPILFKEHTILKTLATGVICSLLIEILQYVTKRGFFEFDDILHNALGACLRRKSEIRERTSYVWWLEYTLAD